MQQTTLMKLIDKIRGDLCVEESQGYKQGYNDACREHIEILQSLLPSERKDIEGAYEAGTNNGLDGMFGVEIITASNYFTTTFITDKTDKE